MARRVVRIERYIKDLIRIRDLQREIARDLDYNKAGAGIDISYRCGLLTILHQEYYERHGKVADVRLIGG